MTKQVQRRRGTATQHTSFTGAEGELSVNTTNKSVHVHDNVTAGGFEAARADMDNVTSSSILTAAGITATTAELNYVDGVTSSIQTQLDGKAGTASPTFTGTLTTANLTATGTTTLASLDVTGTVTADGLRIDASSTGGLKVEDNGGSAGVKVTSFQGTTNDNVRNIEFHAQDFIVHTGGPTGTTTTKRLEVDSITGDISLYEDTGTTAKFFWDASAESLGLGATSFSGETLRMERSGDMILGLFSGASNSTFLNMGTTSNRDAGQIGYTQSSNHMFFRVNDAEAMRIDSSGNVRIGYDNSLSYPSDAKLIVSNAGTNGIEFSNSAISGQNRILNYNRSTSAYVPMTTVGSELKFDIGASEAMRIDSSGKVGIGRTPTSNLLEVADTIKLTNLGTGEGFIGYNTNGQKLSITATDAVGAGMKFEVGSSEAMRIDSSQNLLVGTTDINPGFNDTNTGSAIRSAGSIFTSVSGSTAAYFNRNTSDGEIVSFRKDGAPVGSIGSIGGVVSGITLYPAGNKGIRGETNGIVPWANNADRDDSVNLGASSQRFKDLYLSGGVYLGGTGAANKLDDYEEGTWTPEFTTNGTDFSSVSYDARTGGTYTKIGRVVQIQMTIISDAITVGSATGNIRITGLPFAPSSGTGGGTDQGMAALSVAYSSNWASNPPQAARVLEGTSEIALYTGIATTAAVVVADAQTGANDNYVNITGTYITDA